MSRSVFLDGILSEDAEAARAHVWTFDHASVIGEARRRIFQGEKAAPTDPVRHARDDGLMLPIEPDDWRAAKLARILQHLNLKFSGAPSEAEVVDLCMQAETRVVALLAQLEGPGCVKRGVEPFTGGSILELSRYVLRRMFEQLDASFASKPAAERERIASDIARRLADLPDDVRERIRHEAGLANLSVDALMRTGSIAAVGGAMIGTVGLAGFAAYTSVTSFIAAAAGLAGLTLPFGIYTFATSALAFVSNPLIVGGAVLIGGRFAMRRANRQMRDRLVPVMTATAVMASAGKHAQATRPATLATRLATCLSARSAADTRLRAEIDRTFPCLPTAM